MKYKFRFIALKVILVLIFSITAACSLETENKEFIPDFSQDKMMETISILSAEDGGRIAGFDGEAAAADYIAKQFRSMGLKVDKQSFPVKAFACDNVSFTLRTGDESGIYAKALTFSAATPPGGISADIVPVGMGADDDYENSNVTGKIALIMRGGEYFRVKTERAYEKGAVAAVIYDPNAEEVLSATLTELSSIPAVSIARDDALKIENLISSGEAVKAELVVDSISRDSTSENIIALYNSKDNPDGRCVIVGAHYDGVDTPAANDNASGIAVILEIASAISGQKIPLPYDVKFIAFGAEEIGLVGSTAYVESLTRDEFESVIAMLNYDMVGVGESFEVFTAEGVEAGRFAEIVHGTIEQMGHTPIISKTDRSDHSPFSYAGIEAVDIQMSPFEHYHTDLDTADAIQPDVLVKMCELGTKLLIEEIPVWVYGAVEISE